MRDLRHRLSDLEHDLRDLRAALGRRETVIADLRRQLMAAATPVR